MKTFDDRLRLVRLEPLDKQVMRRPEHVPLKLSDEQRRRQRSAMIRQSFRVASGVAAGILLFAMIGIPAGFAGLRTHLLLMTVVVIGVVGLFGAVIFMTKRIDRIDSIHWMPSAGLCPACGYSIRGVPAESDGCTVCPECGAAWRVPSP